MRFRTEQLKWLILGLLFLASVINFIDRQSLSILARTIQDELVISDLDYAFIVQMFQFAYMLSFLASGWVTDRLGIRASMTLFIAWWSISNLATGLATGVRSLAAARFSLGLGESGLYVVAPKVVGETFPAEQRGLAVGIYTAGATVGATLAPPLIAYMALSFGWRGAFYGTGALGLAWIVPWLIFYRARPRAAAPAADSVQTTETEADDWTWGQILTNKPALLLLAARTITDPVLHFVLFWFPKYLTDVLELSLVEVGQIAWVPYVGADIGCLAGGFLSGRFIRRGISAPEARKRTMVIAAMLIPCSALVPLLTDRYSVLFVVAIVAMAHMMWIVTLTTLAVDLFPSRSLGRIFGLIAAGSGLGGMLFTEVVGQLVTRVSYSPVFVLMGFMHPVALVLIWQAVAAARRPQQPVTTEAAAP